MKKIPVKKKIASLKPSSTLAINEKCKELTASGKKIYKFGFGQSPFPIPQSIVNCLKNNAAPIIMTPHPGEAADLLNIPIKEVQQDRINSAKKLSDSKNYKKDST